MSGKGGKGSKGGKGGDSGELKAVQQVKVKHILCEKQSKILEALKLIREDGKSFNEVASLMSSEKSQLGWVRKVDVVPEFADKAFNQPIGVVSEPFKTQFGYHIILVEDRK